MTDPEYPPPRYTHVGKQVLQDGQHYADARDDRVAFAIVTVLNWHSDAIRRKEVDPQRR